ncbi:MAG: SDR family NAD(P)-dependent oxidoreductase [Spongiibacteraceae bacterium]
MQNNELDLKGRVAIVTGGGRGIGKAIAIALAEKGATVVIATRTASYGEAVVNTISAASGKASLFPLDVSERNSVRELIEDTAKRYGRIDVVVHAAATIPFGNIEKLSDDDFDMCLRSISYAAFWLTKYATPYLEKTKSDGGGRIVFISSTCGPQNVLPGLAHYGMAKNGLEAFVRGAALELGSKGITVNAINPGLIASDHMKESLTEAQAASVAKQFPVARVGQTADIANAVLFLISPQASYVSGHSLVVDGGASLLPSGQVSAMLADH